MCARVSWLAHDEHKYRRAATNKRKEKRGANAAPPPSPKGKKKRAHRDNQKRKSNQCCAHWIDFRSTPSCTISQSGDISRSFSTCAHVISTARSTSASVVKRPRP